jgi:hypothetical protein
MLEELQAASRNKVKPGRPCTLSLADQLLMTLSYWREYRTLFHLGNAFGISEGTASRRVRWVEDVLIKAKRFALPARSQRVAADQTALQAVLIDASESPIERPKKKQRRWYSGKRKRHTWKSQVMMDCASGRILMTATATGRCHDLRLCRDRGLRLPASVYVVADSGYQGLQKDHARTVLPYKAAPKRRLEPEERNINRLHAQLRVRVEHLIRRLKVFWILARPYRNRRRRFGLRLNLIAGLYNFELAYA